MTVFFQGNLNLNFSYVQQSRRTQITHIYMAINLNESGNFYLFSHID
jgi:hypothetical protein